MQDNFKFNTFQQIKIKNENVSSILFDVDVQKSDLAIADIADLNKIRCDISVKREHKKEATIIYKGFLQNLLNGLYQQSTELELVTKKLASGYKILLKFKGYPITLVGNDELILDLNFPTSAFTAAVAANSIINIETIEADRINATGLGVVFDSYVPDTGKSSFDQNIGDSVLAVLLEVDNAATFDASSEAKPVSVDILAHGDFNKKQTQNSLIAQNMQMLHYNPTSSVKNLWLYNSSQRLLNKVVARITFDKAVNEKSLVQVKRLVRV